MPRHFGGPHIRRMSSDHHADAPGAPLSRRELLGIAGAAGALLAVSGQSASAKAGASESGATFESPADELDALVRVLGDRSGRAAPWWYTGYIYGVRPGEEPRRLVRFEGCEINVFTPHGAGTWHLSGATTSYFQDPSSEAVLEEFVNPYTNERLPMKPNLLGGSGHTVYSSAGVQPRWKMLPDIPPQPLAVRWVRQANWVWMRHDRVYPPGLPQPIAEVSTTLIERRALQRRSDAIPALFSSSHISPWPRWLNMAGQAGHTLWHADGVKLRSIEELPPAFLERTRRLYPQQLSPAAA